MATDLTSSLRPSTLQEIDDILGGKHFEATDFVVTHGLNSGVEGVEPSTETSLFLSVFFLGRESDFRFVIAFNKSGRFGLWMWPGGARRHSRGIATKWLDVRVRLNQWVGWVHEDLEAERTLTETNATRARLLAFSERLSGAEDRFLTRDEAAKFGDLLNNLRRQLANQLKEEATRRGLGDEDLAARIAELERRLADIENRANTTPIKKLMLSIYRVVDGVDKGRRVLEAVGLLEKTSDALALPPGG